MELELILIRHGTTQWNREKRYLGHTDMGILQSSRNDLLPLKKELEGRSFSKVFCSDLKRCRETLDIVYPNSPDKVIFDDRLREMDFGDWEGQTYEQLRHSSTYRGWLDDPHSITPPRGESWAHFNARLEEFMEILTCFKKEENNGHSVSSVLIITHGGVIRQLSSMTIPGSTFWDFSADTGSLLTLKITLYEGKWVVRL
jgi:alpha-ribazole phosphatase